MESRAGLALYAAGGTFVASRSDYPHCILENADAGDCDSDEVARAEREGIGRHNSCSGQQDHATRELLAAEEILDEFGEGPLDLINLRLTFKYYPSLAFDLETNTPVARVVFRQPNDNTGSHGTGAGIDLGLRQIEHVLAFDISRTHVVANGEAHHSRR